MKKILLSSFIFSLLLCVSLTAQPYIQWQKSFGGADNETAYSIIQTTDGGYAVAGTSKSVSGDVTGHHGTYMYSDFWVMKINSAGTMQWQKSLGGTGNDEARSIIQTADGGFAVAGYSQSNDGDVTGHHGLLTTQDYWIVKLDTAGTIEWQHSFGGTKNDLAFSIIQTTDHGYAVAGYTFSNDGDVTGLHLNGSTTFDDYWILKLDSTGTMQWQKCLGGVLNEEAHSIIQNADGGYTIAGITNSNYSGDVGALIGSSDYWVVKIDALGSILWSKLFGGLGYDDAWTLLPSSDKGYVIGGHTTSVSGDHDITLNHGSSDYWMIKIDSLGIKEWEHSYGGSGIELTSSLIKTADGGYAFGGYSSSADGDVSGVHGASDFWVVKMDSAGVLEWQKAMGGTGNEQGYSLIQSSDGGYLIAGDAASANGDVTLNQGMLDYWIVKLHPCSTSTYVVNNTSCSSFTFNAQTYTSSGTYTQNFTNFHGCDSLLTLNLTINTPDSTTITASGYCSYTLNSQTYTSSGTYYQQFVNGHSCDSIITLQLTINLIDPSVTQNGVTLNAIQNGASYQWVDCANNYAPIGGETNQTFVASSNGNYAVIISNGNCTDTSVCMSVFSVGITESIANNGFNVAPNPFTKETTLRFDEVQTNTTVRIIDILGKEIRSVMVTGSNQVVIEKGEMKSGIYYIEAAGDYKIVRKKIAVQ